MINRMGKREREREREERRGERKKDRLQHPAKSYTKYCKNVSKS